MFSSSSAPLLLGLMTWLLQIQPAALFHHDWASFPPQDQEAFQKVMDERRQRLRPGAKPLFPKESMMRPPADDYPPQQPPQAQLDTANSNCQTFRILLTHEETKAGITSDFGDDFGAIDFGTLQGGKVVMRHPNDLDTNGNLAEIGEYTVLTTFLGPMATDGSFQVDCYGVGSYQFTSTTATTEQKNTNAQTTTMGDQISFVAPCSGLPYFTITGGQGKYVGAQGYVEYRIPDPANRGFFHEIHVCTNPHHVKALSSSQEETA